MEVIRKKKKKIKHLFLLIIEIVLCLAITSGLINWFRVFNYEKPIFVYEAKSEKIQGLHTYYGLGHKIIIKKEKDMITKKEKYEISNYYALGFLIYTFD